MRVFKARGEEYPTSRKVKKQEKMVEKANQQKQDRQEGEKAKQGEKVERKTRGRPKKAINEEEKVIGMRKFLKGMKARKINLRGKDGEKENEGDIKRMNSSDCSAVDKVVKKDRLRNDGGSASRTTNGNRRERREHGCG